MGELRFGWVQVKSLKIRLVGTALLVSVPSMVLAVSATHRHCGLVSYDLLGIPPPNAILCNMGTEATSVDVSAQVIELRRIQEVGTRVEIVCEVHGMGRVTSEGTILYVDRNSGDARLVLASETGNSHFRVASIL